MYKVGAFVHQRDRKSSRERGETLCPAQTNDIIMSHNRPLFWTLTALFGAALIAFWAAAPQAQQDFAAPAAARGPVVVELFTSQSCSSCPPADAVLDELDHRDNIIALGCHVTYWDHLDWKDTLSQPFCTQRQRAYAAARGSGRVYTPQMVVNGQVEFIGSNRGKAVQEVNKAAKAGAIRPITITRSGPGTLRVTLPHLGPGAPRQTLWLLTYRNKHSQSIGSGENRGRTVAYVNPVSALAPLDTWDGQATTRTYALPPERINAPDTDGYVILAQAPTIGPILAAGKISLSNH